MNPPTPDHTALERHDHEHSPEPADKPNEVLSHLQHDFQKRLEAGAAATLPC